MKNEKMKYTKKEIEKFLENNMEETLFTDSEFVKVVEIRVTSFEEGLKISKLFNVFMGESSAYYYLHTFDLDNLRKLYRLRLKTLSLHSKL